MDDLNRTVNQIEQTKDREAVESTARAPHRCQVLSLANLFNTSTRSALIVRAQARVEAKGSLTQWRPGAIWEILIILTVNTVLNDLSGPVNGRGKKEAEIVDYVLVYLILNYNHKVSRPFSLGPDC